MKYSFKVATIIFLMLSASTLANAARPIIVDTDAGIDDSLATLYLLKNPNVDVKAISIVGDGEAHCLPAVQNMEGVVALSGKTNVPVGCSHSLPLKGQHDFPSFIRTKADDLAGEGSLLPHLKSKIPMQDSVTLLQNTLQKSLQPIDIVTIGPLSNLADLIKRDPAIIHKIGTIYIMGGAIKVSGNLMILNHTLKNNLAEWNIYIDPYAADVVFRSGVRIVLVPLDVTNQVPVDYSFYHYAKQHATTPIGKFVFGLYRGNEKEIEEHRWYYWDVLAAVIASDDSLIKTFPEKLRIVLSPETKAGATVRDDKNGNKIFVGTAVNAKKFKKNILHEFFSG